MFRLPLIGVQPDECGMNGIKLAQLWLRIFAAGIMKGFRECEENE